MGWQRKTMQHMQDDCWGIHEEYRIARGASSKKEEISRPKNSPGVLAWFEQKGSLAVTGRMQDISKNMLNCLPRG